MRPGKKQIDLCRGDCSSEGNRFVDFSKERQTKTHTGENPRNLGEKKPEMYKSDHFSINTYLAYKNYRPTDTMTGESSILLFISGVQDRVSNGDFIT